MITFVSNDDIAVAVRFHNKMAKSIEFELYAAVEEIDCFNIIGTNGRNADKIEDATTLATGKVFTTNGENFRYSLIVFPHRMFGKEFQGFVRAINEIKQLGARLVKGEEVDEYEYSSEDDA